MVRPLSRHGVPVLKRASSKPQAVEAVAERLGGLIARPAAARLRLAHVHERLEERAGRQDDGRRAVERVAAASHADDRCTTPSRRLVDAPRSILQRRCPSTISCRSVRFACASTRCFMRELVELLVRLGARRVHGRALGAVEHAELDAGGVDDLAHLAAEGVDLADDLPLGDAADGRVAAHLADGVGVHGAGGRCAAPAAPPPGPPRPRRGRRRRRPRRSRRPDVP